MTSLARTLLILLVSPFFFHSDLLCTDFSVHVNCDTEQWLIKENDRPVLQYNYGTLPLPEGYLEKLTHGQIYAVPRSDYIHPLFDLDGKPVTLDWAMDHAHHRGIYWAWPEVGYKEELADLHALQGVFARPNGKIESRVKDGSVVLEAESLWKWKDEEPIVHETTLITVHPLGRDGRKIDLEFRFKGLADEVTLARRGTEFYGGLNIRMAPLDAFQSGVFNEEESSAAKQSAAWVFGTWNDAASGKKMELTVFEKADNPDYPGDYIHYPDIQWFQPTFPNKGTRYSLKKDETLVLRYQLWLHEATYDDAAKTEAWKEFQAVK
ncbi:MAG: PmoA family protein [Planctomycetaceae bacterium]|nr:PmoA family protein [Planctomycetaceae bacterium]